MRLANLSFLLFGFLLVSCHLKPDTPIAKPQEFDSKQYADSLKFERSKHKVPKLDSTKLVKSDSLKNPMKKSYSETTDTIQLKIVSGKVKMDTVKNPRQRLVFVLNSDTANKLNIKLTPQDSIANIRISQVIDSKGNSDGPFGQEIQHPIVEKGTQYIIVSENQMQGEPWGGRFQFELKLGW
jgi:hypothetical protein